MPAWKWLQQVERGALIRILFEYGETSDAAAARRIADAICLARDANQLPKRTREFAELVARAKGREYQKMHPAKLTFQALRVHLNREFDEMRRGLHAAFELVGEGGRLGLLTWKHSECAIVVDFFRSLEATRPELPLLRWYQAQHNAPPLPEGWALSMDEAVRPSDVELQRNSRSRSAILHVLRKQRAPLLSELERRAYPLLGWALPTPAGPSASEVADGASAASATSAAGGAAAVGGAAAADGAQPGEKKRAKKEKAAAAAAAAAAGGSGAAEGEGKTKEKKKKKKEKGENGEPSAAKRKRTE